MKGQEAIFSHNSDEWSTPQEIYDELDREFHFNLDPCATKQNHKCNKFFTAADNGLIPSWGGYNVFCNPPYSNIKEWVKKAYRESFHPHTTVVLLIPARVDTKWFHEWIYHRAEVRFIKGRLKFGDSVNSAPFPSMIVIYRSGGD